MNNDLGSNLIFMSHCVSHNRFFRYFHQCHRGLSDAASSPPRAAEAPRIRVPTWRAAHRETQFGAEELSAARGAVTAALRRQQRQFLFRQSTARPAAVEGNDRGTTMFHCLLSSHPTHARPQASFLPVWQLDRRLPVEQ